MSAASVLTIISASLSCPLLQPPTSGPFTSSFGGAGCSDDPFKSKQDTPALPPKKPAPPRPKPPSGQYAFFSHSHPPTVARQRGHCGPLLSPAQSRADAAGPALRAGGSPLRPVAWVRTHCVPGTCFLPHLSSPRPLGLLAPGCVGLQGGLRKAKSSEPSLRSGELPHGPRFSMQSWPLRPPHPTQALSQVGSGRAQGWGRQQQWLRPPLNPVPPDWLRTWGGVGGVFLGHV